MKRGIFLLFIGLLALTVKAQEKSAKIEFKSETIDYGEIEKGSDGIRVFEFTNTGDVPLVISAVVVQFPRSLRHQYCREKQEKSR